MIRAMVLDFQDDPSTYNIQDQYMFGDAFLVAPVYKPVSKRTVIYLKERGTNTKRARNIPARRLCTSSLPWTRCLST